MRGGKYRCTRDSCRTTFVATADKLCLRWQDISQVEFPLSHPNPHGMTILAQESSYHGDSDDLTLSTGPDT